jgi:beta-lactam-binding protein with PASTA domain/tRNA A-37 threonylcarbamoyl transferase component Bud32
MPGSASSDLLPGRVLAGRYLLHGAIGTGASGRVYVADDQRLRRRVAVKVLHAALADDTAFLRRFRAEAQLAASLRHANIVTVYDWGQDEVPFMVLELLEGGSLRSMLDQGTVLTVAQAARIGRDVASALEYAHARDVLHRDIKPANLLFDEHGIVRVADFGLARALAEASWTEPAGGMLGTARYASPEQATGLQLDARSDLYSLALVLVESVTGRVPFAADTTIGMLTARTQRPLIAPEALGPLAAVIDRAGCVQPGDRYPDAGTMRQALADVADTLAPPGPLVLAGMVDQHDPHPTRVAAPAKPPLFDQDAAPMPQQSAPSVRETARPARTRDPERPGRKRVPGQRRLVPFVVAAVLLATVAIAASAFARVSGATTLSVPGFVGRSEASAEALARGDGLTYSISQQVSPDPKHVVVGQSPASGSWTAARHVRLVVSTGPAPVSVPRITGESWTTAKRQLDAIGFSYAPPTAAYNARFAANTVAGVTPPPGTQVAPDAPVAIVLSKGFAPVGVPNVSGQPYDAAAAALAAQHLRPHRANDVFSADVQQGLVISTVPSANQSVPYNSVVQIVVSRGPVLVKVPDLRTLTLTQAQVVIDATHGLGIAINGSEHGNDVVVDQTPSPGAMVPLATTTVTLTFGPAPSH